MITYAKIKKANTLSDSFQEDQNSKKTSNLKDGKQLVFEAIISITDIVESMHHRISPISKLTHSPESGRTKGLTGLVYKGIRSLTTIVGKGIDVPLEVISDLLTKSNEDASSNALRSTLNGILGDHLVERNSSLAIPMALKHEGKQLDAALLTKFIEQSNGKIVIMVHGLCMNDQQWQKDGHDHGKALANDLGHTAIYLHYNSGLHISKNGKAFSDLLEQLVTQTKAANSELPLEISIVAHSMGGLVSRSAYHQAQLAKQQWPDSIKNICFLGTPHHGAPLEKLGNWLDVLVGLHAYSAPLKSLLKVRSAGITDLRHGNIIESDWQARNRFDFSRDKRTPLALPESVNCYTIATTASAVQNRLNEQVIGDGLVSLNSALGKHQNKSFTLQFPTSHQWIGRDINHIQLLSSPDVYAVIKKWLKGDVIDPCPPDIF